ncbi:MAG TPA: DUF4446 family protein [Herpetosiphonaceae bacterium]
MSTFWTNYGFYLWLLTAVGLIAACGVTFRLSRQVRAAVGRYTTLVAGVDGADLDAIWQERAAQVASHETDLRALQATVGRLSESSIQHVGLVRFNPFGDVGGDQSFAVALLDGERSGVVLSSIYSRAGVRTYGKQVLGGASTHPLSDEEEAAIAQALSPLTTPIPN